MLYFLAAFFLAIVFTWLIRRLALRMSIVDNPDKIKRKKHHQKIALLGGTAIFAAFWLIIFYLVFFTDLLVKNIQPFQLLIIFLAGLILIILGFFDDKYSLNPLLRLLITLLVIFVVVLLAIDLQIITNPWGGFLSLNFYQFSFFDGLGSLVLAGDILVFIWLTGMMYTTKILDGLDGLTTGLSLIGSLMIFFLASTDKFYQTDVRLIALVLAGACLGFLLFNFYPAKIFLGEGGSLFLGFMLGVLSVIAGSKIATALLVMAVPILDLVWVVYQRLHQGTSVFSGDRLHLHFRLVDHGFSQPKTVLILYLVSFLFGITTLILPSKYKLAVLLLLVILFLVIEKKLLSKKDK